MAQWGSDKFTGNSAPNWFFNLATGPRDLPANNIIYQRPNHPASNEMVCATSRGWEKVIKYDDSSGTTRYKRELLVSIRGLANNLAYGSNVVVGAGATTLCACPEILATRWADANSDPQYTAPEGQAVKYSNTATSNIGMYITFSESVFVDTTGGTPSFDVIQTGGAGTNPLQYNSGSGTNVLLFSNTITTGSFPLDVWSDLELKVSNDTNGAAAWIDLNGGVISGVTSEYGRGSNTVTADTSRLANLSSRGVGAALPNSNTLVSEREGVRLSRGAPWSPGRPMIGS